MGAPKKIKVDKHGLKVRQARDIQERKLQLKADAVIVGSGAGGAVMAFELARAGKKVIVLEAGPYVPSSRFTEEPAQSLETMYQDRGSQTNKAGDILVLQGRCVGGSTVVNAAIAFRTPDSVLAEWRRDHGLKNLSAAALGPHFDKIEQRLSVHENLPHEIDQNSRVIEKGCRKLGIELKPLSRNIKNCALTGFCVAGCASDRKQSMLVTYLPWAAALGARIFADTKVTRIMAKNGRATGVRAEVTDPESGEIVSRLRVDAPIVVLAAGAVQSPLLLLKSELANSSGWVGRNFACHPSLFVAARYPEPVYGWKGALSSSYVEDFAHHDRGGFLLITNMVGPLELSMAIGTGTGAKHMELMKDIKYMAAINSLMHDRNHGRVTYANGAKTIEYDIHKQDMAAVRKTLKVAARIHLAAGAQKVYLPTLRLTTISKEAEVERVVDAISLEPNNLHFTTFHPQGTCRMGGDPAESVVDEYGQCHDVKGLYVADASIFPATTLFHPQMTVYGLSSYIAENIIERDGA